LQLVLLLHHPIKVIFALYIIFEGFLVGKANTFYQNRKTPEHSSPKSI